MEQCACVHVCVFVCVCMCVCWEEGERGGRVCVCVCVCALGVLWVCFGCVLGVRWVCMGALYRCVLIALCVFMVVRFVCAVGWCTPRFVGDCFGVLCALWIIFLLCSLRGCALGGSFYDSASQCNCQTTNSHYSLMSAIFNWVFSVCYTGFLVLYKDQIRY
jgi:hypothetical protein